MRIRKIVQRRVRGQGDGVNVAADVNAAVIGSVNESGAAHTKASSSQRLVQRNGRTVVSESRTTTSERTGGGEEAG